MRQRLGDLIGASWSPILRGVGFSRVFECFVQSSAFEWTHGNVRSQGVCFDERCVFSRTPLQSLCLASACKWLASRHSLGEVGVSVRLFSCGEEDCVLAPLRSVGARFGRSLFACLWWSSRAAGALCVFAKSVWRVLCHV